MRLIHPLPFLFSLSVLMATLPVRAAEDPYLWLEPFTSPQVDAWVQHENQRTLANLEGDPHFQSNFDAALAIAQASDRIAKPELLGGAIYNFWQDAQHVRGLWRRTTRDDFATAAPHWTTVLDLDALAQREHANWVWKGAECEDLRQQRCMVLLSDGGEDAITAREFDLVTRRFVSHGFVLPHGKSRLAWEDRDTLLVAREFAPGETTTAGYPYLVKRLRRGQALAAAREVFRGSHEDGGYGVEPIVLQDDRSHRLALIRRPRSTFEFDIALVTTSGTVPLALPHRSDPVALVQDQLIVHTLDPWTDGATTIPAGSVVALDRTALVRTPDQLHPQLILAPGQREGITEVTTTRDTVIVSLLENVRGRLRVFQRDDRQGWSGRTLALPDKATLSLVSSDHRGDTAYLLVDGFLAPETLWRLTTRKGADSVVTPLRSLPEKFDATREVVEQFEAASSDGTAIPYFVVHPKDYALDVSHPTVLTAYGGFNIAITPEYNPVVGKLWLEPGGVYVVANIRGGGEFGPAWHDAGLKTHRQVIYDDFAAVARDLIRRGITTPRHLGIVGGSNGGLLMGVEMTQHPELWNAVDIAVPLLDMLRYEQIAAWPSWVGEYGSVSNPDEQAFLAGISPYAQLRPDVKYPEALIWTTTKDDRVGPQHARKFAARLAEFGQPYLFYEVTEGGHGAGANLKEGARTRALEWTWFTRRLVGG